MIRLYHHNVSSAAQKIRIALYEKQLEWTGIEVDLMNREHLSEAYLRINPRGVVPALDHDGNIVIESSVILEYLEDEFPEFSLRPASAFERARMRLWMRRPDDGLQAACGCLSFVSAFAPQVRANHTREQWEQRLSTYPDRSRAAQQMEIFERGFDAQCVEEAVWHYEKLLAGMNAALESSQWLAGDSYSLADVAITPYVTRLDRLGLDQMWAGLPEVSRWFNDIRARPSFAQAITAFPSNTYDDELKKRGIDVWPEVAKLLKGAR